MPENVGLLLLGGFGLVTCVAGYRLFILALALLGAGLGGYLGLMVGHQIGSGIAAVVGTGVGALLFGVLAVTAYRVCIALMGGMLFGAAAAVLLLPLGPIAQVLGGVVAAAAGGGVALLLQRGVIMLATSVQGALAVVVAGVVLAADGGSIAEYQYRLSLIVSGAQPPARVLGHPAIALLWAAVAVAGIALQATWTSRGAKGPAGKK